MHQLVCSSSLIFRTLLTIFSDAEGHEGRDCTAPKDWSRVTCRNCGEKGHTIKRCKQPIKEQENTRPSGDATASGDGGFGNKDGGFGNADAGDGGSGGGDWDKPAGESGGGDAWDSGKAAGQNDWESTPAPVAAGAGAGGGW